MTSDTVKVRPICENPPCSNRLPPGRRRFCSDLCRVRGQRSERKYDNIEFGKSVIRMVRALSKRVQAADIDTFGALWDLQQAVDDELVITIDELRARGYSWADFAAQTGQTKQGMSQWRKRRPAGSGVNESFTEGEASA